jgi:hypothetical protein
MSVKTKPPSEVQDGERPVLVTTAHRGVFFGYAKDTTGETIALRAARCCVYWSRDVKGFLGLAALGPSPSCRVGPPATITLRNITSVAEVTGDAVAKWEAAPWS